MKNKITPLKDSWISNCTQKNKTEVTFFSKLANIQTVVRNNSLNIQKIVPDIVQNILVYPARDQRNIFFSAVLITGMKLKGKKHDDMYESSLKVKQGKYWMKYFCLHKYLIDAKDD